MTKQTVLDEIAGLIGIAKPKMSTGSTEPREFLLMINRQLGLGISDRLTKPQLAQEIVERAGLIWSPACESRGSTVTLVGLLQVKRAVEFFVGEGF